MVIRYRYREVGSCGKCERKLGLKALPGDVCPSCGSEDFRPGESDPPDDALLTYGEEFKRMNPDRRSRVTDLAGNVIYDSGPIEEVICDFCNAEVGNLDPCTLTGDRLYCQDCAKRWIFPYRIF
jgi:hypothetical protein